MKGSFLRDLGKIGISVNIQLKPARLDELEFKVIQTRINQGIEIAGHSSWLHDSIDVIRCHHEKYSRAGLEMLW